MNVAAGPVLASIPYFDQGKVIDAVFGSDGGRRALRRMLEAKEGRLKMVKEGPTTRPPRMTESTIAQVVAMHVVMQFQSMLPQVSWPSIAESHWQVISRRRE